MARTTLYNFLAGMVLAALLSGCGGGTSGTVTNPAPTVSLIARPNSIAPGGTASLSWSSTNATAVQSSNFGATTTAGTATVGPLTATTDYTLTVTGPTGSASAHATVVVNAGTTPTAIPAGVLLYSIQNTSGGSTLYYQPITGGAPVSVGTYAANVTVFGTDATGTRLILSEPVNGNATTLGAYVTDLDGVSHPTRMSTDTWPAMTDALIASNGDVLIASEQFGTRSYTGAGVFLDSYNATVSASVNAAATEVVLAYPGALNVAQFPTLSGGVQISTPTDGQYSWVRWSPASADLVASEGSDIWTLDATGANAMKIASNASYPTFDNTGTRVFYARPGDGIYEYNLNTSAESKLVSIAGTWSGRIIWH